MSKRSQPENQNRTASTEDTFHAEDSAWEPTAKALKDALMAFASLRLTVALLAMAIFIVLAGTLGQVHRDIWDVTRDYFRMDFTSNNPMATTFTLFGKERIVPSPMTWIDLSIFFPPSFSADNVPPDLSKMTSPARILSSLILGFGWAALVWLFPLKDKKLQFAAFASVGVTFTMLSAGMHGFWFPKGWTIGAVMAVNLLAAHLIRFKIQSKGARLWGGVGVIALGLLAIIGVIQSGSNKEGVLKENFLGSIELDWSTIWVLFELTLGIVLVLGIYGYISLWRRTLRQPSSSERSATVTMRRVAGFGNLLLAGLLIYFIQGGSDTQLNDSGMRILWQLLKATAAGLVFLAGCVLVFRKRAGVVVLHSGVALIMLSELLVGVAAVETQMQIVEGESSNFVQDIREVEIAVTDPNQPDIDRVVSIPQRMLKEGNLIRDDRLPVNIRVDAYYRNSQLDDVKPDEKNPATLGFGDPKSRSATIARPVQGSTGTDTGGKVDQASAYVTLFSKDDNGDNDRNLGTMLLSQWFMNRNLQALDQEFEARLQTLPHFPPIQTNLQTLHDHLEQGESGELRGHRHRKRLPFHHRLER